jgi:hypothetical protein
MKRFGGLQLPQAAPAPYKGNLLFLKKRNTTIDMQLMNK